MNSKTDNPSKRLLDLIKQHPILTTCSVLTMTSGAFLANWVIRNIDKAVSRQDSNIITNNENEEKVSEDIKNDDDESDTMTHNNHETLSGDKIQIRIPKYNGPNPFIQKPLSLYEKIKIYFFCMNGIVYIKMATTLLITSSMYLLSIPPKNIICTSIQRILLRLLLFNFGFYYIKGKFTNLYQSDKSHRVIVANHNTVFDGLVLLTMTYGCIAAKKELSKIPIAGRIMNNGLSMLWIDRTGAKGRGNAKQQILDYVNDYSKPPLIIFPQGTCSNTQTMTCFKAGAFMAKKPVLPIALNWNGNKYCDLSYVSTQSELAMIIHIGCCQFINFCRVYISNVYHPNIDEQENINLFANNVRNVIAENMKKGNEDFQCTPHSLSDFMLFRNSVSSQSRVYQSGIIMGDIVSLLNLRSKTVSYLAERFRKLDLNHDGFIDFDEFCKAFKRDGVKHEKQMKSLFETFNTDNNAKSYEKIGFDEFLVGVSLCFMDNMIDDAIKVMFNGCLNYNTFTIQKDDILKVYNRSVDEKKFGDVDQGYNEWIAKMKEFLNVLFNNDDEELDFNTFYERIMENKLENMVQHFLQSIITMTLKIKLQKKDFSLTNESESEIFVNPATQFVRSESIVGVKS